MAKTVKRRARTSHPGITLKKRKLPSGEVSWRCHYIDPDTRKETAVTCSKMGATNHKERVALARELSEMISSRRRDQKLGIERAPRQKLAEAIEQHLTDLGREVKAKTLANYEHTMEEFTAWAEDEGVIWLGDLTEARLRSFRRSAAARPKHFVRKGQERGKRSRKKVKSTGQPVLRAPSSVNKVLREVRAITNGLVKRGLLPHLSRDRVGIALEPLKVQRKMVDILRPDDVRRLLEACVIHDTATFDVTREEIEQGLPHGSTKTPRHEPIAPLIATALLTGARLGELLGIRWRDVRLDAVDDLGSPVGEILVRAESSKVGRDRIVDLTVSPCLRRLLAALRDRDGGRGVVFDTTVDSLKAALPRLTRKYGAPRVSFQKLRRSCASVLVNANIWTGDPLWRTSRQLGHSREVLERHYAGALRGLPRDARSIEAALGVTDLLERLLVLVTT